MENNINKNIIIIKVKSFQQSSLIDSLLINHPESSILQNPLFALKFYPRRSVRYFIMKDGQIPVAGCLVSEYLFNAEIQFGPISDNTDNTIVLINYISNYYKKKYYAKLKLCLPFNLNNEECKKIYFTISKENNIELQRKNNWSTLLIDLKKDLNLIISDYTGNHRRDINKAQNLNLKIKSIENESEIINFATIFDKLYIRRKVRPQWGSAKQAFSAWYKILYFNKKAIWMGVYNDEEKMLGAILLINEGERLLYQIGASDPDYRKIPILHLCIHEAIKYARNNNFKYFDFGGYDTDATPADQTYNINMFKKHFGGILVSSFPNMNIILNKPVKLLMDFFFRRDR